MGLTMDQRKALTREMADRYRRASKRQKTAMLDEFVELHGCTRHHAGWVLRMWGKTVFERRDGEEKLDRWLRCNPGQGQALRGEIVVGQRRRGRSAPGAAADAAAGPGGGAAHHRTAASTTSRSSPTSRGAEEGLVPVRLSVRQRRLVAVLRAQVPLLEKFGELDLDPDTRQALAARRDQRRPQSSLVHPLPRDRPVSRDRGVG